MAEALAQAELASERRQQLSLRWSWWVVETVREEFLILDPSGFLQEQQLGAERFPCPAHGSLGVFFFFLTSLWWCIQVIPELKDKWTTLPTLREGNPYFQPDCKTPLPLAYSLLLPLVIFPPLCAAGPQSRPVTPFTSSVWKVQLQDYTGLA